LAGAFAAAGFAGAGAAAAAGFAGVSVFGAADPRAPIFSI
jgi:hypothetical protein